MSFINKRRLRRNKMVEHRKVEQKANVTIEQHFEDLKRIVASRARPEFHDMIMGLNKQQFLDLLDILDKNHPKEDES